MSISGGSLFQLAHLSGLIGRDAENKLRPTSRFTEASTLLPILFKDTRIDACCRTFVQTYAEQHRLKERGAIENYMTVFIEWAQQQDELRKLVSVCAGLDREHGTPPLCTLSIVATYWREC